MLKIVCVRLIIIYQRFFRPLLPITCRFEPSCSEYALQAISKYGFISGGFKALKRLFCCHPFSGKSGFDPLI